MKEMKGARILANTCGVVKIGEKVLIATDKDKIQIANIIAEACIERGVDPIILSMVPRKNHGEEPPALFSIALREADVVFAVTTFSLFHTNARTEACKRGVRWVNLPGFSMQMLREGGLFVDFYKQREKAKEVGQILSSGSSVQVITDKGFRFISAGNYR